MFISVVIPVYNCCSTLRNTVDSVIRANLWDYEILLIDDGSTDGSSELADRLAKENEVIHGIHQENAGVSAARNRGLAEAIGDYILFIDADDTVEPELLRNLTDKLAEASDIDMAVFGLTFDYYRKGTLYRRDEILPSFSGIQTEEDCISHLMELFSSNSLSPVWNKIFRRSMLSKNDLCLREDMFLYEDLEFSLRAMEHCNRILFEPTAIYHYRQSEDEGNAGRRLQKIEHIPSLVDSIESALDSLSRIKKEVLQPQKMDILTGLYLVLAREKIDVSNRKAIQQICDDFALWAASHPSLCIDNKYYSMLLHRQVFLLSIKKYHSKLRHAVAIRVKSTKWYQKRGKPFR